MNPHDLESIVRSLVSETLSRRQAGQTVAPEAVNGSTARVAMLETKSKLALRRYPIPTIGPDEILVRVEACGICGTDIHCYKKDPFGFAPLVLGHEGTGKVVELGKNVKEDNVGKPIRVGDNVVTSILDNASECMIARYNPLKANLSDDLRVYGLIPDSPDYHFNGYFADYLVIRPGSSFFVVNDMSEDLRVLIEPAAVVCHALDRAKFSNRILNFRSRVVVQGCGPIGLMMIAVLRTHGINNIIAIDGNDNRLAIARRMGADDTINYNNYENADQVASAVKDLTKGLGAHFGFQVTGVPAAFSNLFKCIRRGGGICEVGHFVDGGETSINPHFDICHKEITLTGSWAYNAYEYPNAYHFLQRAERIGIPVSELITHRFPLDQIEEAFQTNIRQEGIKIVVKP